MSVFELFYWPGLQGRGEFPRLMLEDSGAEYIDVTRLPEEEGGGVTALLDLLGDDEDPCPPYAAPILRHGEQVLSQTTIICSYLGITLGLCPKEEVVQRRVNQLQLTLMDVAAEAHNVHHPVGTALYYEDQAAPAKLAALSFVSHRLPKYLGYFERVLRSGQGEWLVDDQFSYADLSLFQVLEGLCHAFPRAYEAGEPSQPRLAALRQRVAARPKLQAYLASKRRVPFNDSGIFRFYPELDVLAPVDSE